MKFAVISDVHSNLHALEAVLDDAENHGVKKIYCLGDLVGYGGCPKEVVDIAQGFDFVLRGNHDDCVTFKIPKDFNPTAAKGVYWTRAQLKADHMASKVAMKRWTFMRRHLSKKVKIGPMLFAHGTPESYFVYIDTDKAAMRELSKFPEDVHTLFCGHTHVAGVYVERVSAPGKVGPVSWLGPYKKDYPKLGEKRMIINVGSVGQPRDHDVRASYVLVNGDKFFFRRVPYDVKAAVECIKQRKGLPKDSALRLECGT